MKLALNIATRNRPKLLYDTVMATHHNMRRLNTVLMISADADDNATLEFFETLSPAIRDRLLISVEPREDTVGAKWNRVLAAVPGADVYMPVADDGPITTPGFDEKILEAAAIFPDGIGVVYSRIEKFTRFPGLQAVTRRLAELMGGEIYVTHFPYWWVDAWLDDIAQLIDRIAFADVDHDDESNRPPTMEMREPHWWATFFDACRLRRRTVAHRIIDAMTDEPWRKKLLRTHHPLIEFRSKWLNDGIRGNRELAERGRRNPPDDRYRRIKAAAEKMLRDELLPQLREEERQRGEAIGGGAEMAWYAQLQEARLLRELKDEGGFLRQALTAFNQRPHRAEPLYDLARFYRERGMNAASVLFSEPGLALPRPSPESDTLFVEDFVYQAGLREEYSIAANYAHDPARKDRGFAACNWLALGRGLPANPRGLARHNLRFYVQSANTMLPSFTARPVGFAPPDGYRPTNPSVALWGEDIVLLQRAVNYTMTEDGGYRTPDGSPITTRNFLLRLSAALEVEAASEILPPADMPEPAFRGVLGFEDMRLFAWRGELWCSACVRELTPEGWCEQVLARIDGAADGPRPGPDRLVDWRVLRPEAPRRHEKNWMPLVAGDTLQFIYLCDPTRLVDDAARTVAETTPPIAAEQFRGGSQAIEFAYGRLALVHEVLLTSSYKERIYHHRFVWIDPAGALRGVSRPFFFGKQGIEYAAGLAWHPDGKRLLISYGVTDSEAWLATVDGDEVRRGSWRTRRDCR